MLLYNFPDGILNLLLVPDIASASISAILAGLFLQSLHSIADVLLLPTDDIDGGAVQKELLGDAEANAGTAATDQSYLAGQGCLGECGH